MAATETKPSAILQITVLFIESDFFIVEENTVETVRNYEIVCKDALFFWDMQIKLHSTR